jgi:mannose-6-phosphate isomerase-like protein (cupin superfamily)
MTTSPVRVVVTGHDTTGDSVVHDDRMVPAAGSAAAGTHFHVLWGADVLPSYPDDGSEPSEIAAFPPVGGIRFVQMIVTPDSEVEYAEQETVAGIHADEGAGPGMHTTPSVDFVVVIEGEVCLELSHGREVHLRPGDCVVQNGTLHGWRNHTDKPARVGVMLVGTEHLGLAAN